MTDEELKIAQVTAKLVDVEAVFDNPITNRREIWCGGRIVLERRRDMCDGSFFATWGTYSERPPIEPAP